MQRWQGLSDVPSAWGRCVVTIGVFDGVHRGHGVLIGRAVHAGRERSLPVVVLTFDPHPVEVLSPGNGPAQLTTPAHKADLLAGLGVAAVLALPFTAEMARLSPESFVHDVLVGALHADVVVVGANFTFGHRAAGKVADLVRLGAPLGLTVLAQPLLEQPVLEQPRLGQVREVVSATRIRELLGHGDVDGAAALLGHPFRADGVVVRGEQRGRSLGYPTANLQMASGAAVPADGVYAGRVVRLDAGGSVSGEPALGVAAISVGTNPTFDGVRRTVEAFILDFDGDLYGEPIGVEFWHRLRGMVKFDSIDALIVQMDADVVRTRELVHYF